MILSVFALSRWVLARLSRAKISFCFVAHAQSTCATKQNLEGISQLDREECNHHRGEILGRMKMKGHHLLLANVYMLVIYSFL